MRNIENEMKRERKRHVPIDQKVKAIQDYSLGVFSIQDLADKFCVGNQTVLNWINNSRKIFAQCYISDSINTEAADSYEASEEAYILPTDIDIQTDLIKKNRELKKAHEWDTNRIAYLESLLELNNIDPKRISKKKDRKQSFTQSKIKK